MVKTLHQLTGQGIGQFQIPMTETGKYHKVFIVVWAA